MDSLPEVRVPVVPNIGFGLCLMVSTKIIQIASERQEATFIAFDW